MLRGWTPPTTTTHYDADGNITGRSVTEVEPVWDEQSRAELLALGVLDARPTCPACGGPPEECQTADADDAYEAEPVRCHKATAVGEAQERYRENPQPQALLWTTTRRG